MFFLHLFSYLLYSISAFFYRFSNLLRYFSPPFFRSKISLIFFESSFKSFLLYLGPLIGILFLFNFVSHLFHSFFRVYRLFSLIYLWYLFYDVIFRKLVLIFVRLGYDFPSISDSDWILFHLFQKLIYVLFGPISTFLFNFLGFQFF